MKKIIKIILVGILLILIIFFVVMLYNQNQYKSKPTKPVDSSIISIDFSVAQGPIKHTASGFLFNPRDFSWPPRDILLQLKPKQSRLIREVHLIDGMYDYITNDLNIKSNMLLLNAGALDGGYWPGDNNDWEQYDNFLTKIISEAKSQSYVLEYDIWNEPNLYVYWARSDKQFFETWKHAVQLIRKIDPNLQIIGPSTKNFGTDQAEYDADEDGKIETYMEEFLGYVKINNVAPDILNWHENNEEPDTNPAGGAANIKPHVELARKMIKDLNLPIKKIYINEYSADTVRSANLNLNEKYNGAFAIQYFSALEEAKVDVALRSCWGEHDFFHRGNSCFDRLDNLITYDGKPRSNWYAYKAYADMGGDLVNLELEPGVSGIATLESSNKSATLLVGMLNPVESLVIKINNLPQDFGEEVTVKINRISYSGMKEASSVLIVDEKYNSVNGKFSIELNNTQEGDIFIVTLK